MGYLFFEIKENMNKRTLFACINTSEALQEIARDIGFIEVYVDGKLTHSSLQKEQGEFEEMVIGPTKNTMRDESNDKNYLNLRKRKGKGKR